MQVESPTRTEKELALEAVQQMPESSSLERISEELAILAAIRRGEKAADAGRTLSHQEVERRSATWTSK